MKRIHRIGAACALPLALAACGLTRPPASVEAPTPARWNTPLPDTALPHTGSLPSLASWWRDAGDPVLAELIEAAQAASPTVASAATRIAEARATRVQAGAALAPSLDGALSATRSNSPTSGVGGRVGATGAAGAGAGAGASTSIPPVTIGQAGLQSSWEIDLFGGLRAGRDAAGARLDASTARWHDARVSVAAETANAYFAERACARQLVVAESDTRSRLESARLTDLSAQAGFTAPADAALARAGAADASGRLKQQIAQCQVLRQGLVAMTGLDADELARKLDARPGDLALPAMHPVDQVPARTLAQRPDVYAAEHAVAAASADVGAAQAQRYPRLSLTGNIGRLQIRTAGFRETLDSWSIGPVQLTVPIFDGGTRAANAESAQARYDEAVVQYRASIRNAVKEVEEALVNLQSTDARSTDADSAVRDHQASFDATEARYRSGLASQFELEDARRTLFAAQTARVGLQRERATVWVSLYRALGGGWTRPDTQAAAPAAPEDASTHRP